MKTSGSRVGVLITGVTLAVLRVEGTWPVNIDELMILVIGSTRTSRQSFSIHVGSGSSVQDFVDHQKGRGESLNSLESEKQDLELNSLYERQPVKLSQYRSRTMRGATLCTHCSCL